MKAGYSSFNVKLKCEMNSESNIQNTLKALADPTRREILEILKSGRQSAGDIGKCFNITGAAISRHLSVLKEADLIRDEREGKFIFYELNLSIMEELLTWFGNFQATRRSKRSPQQENSRPEPQH